MVSSCNCQSGSGVKCEYCRRIGGCTCDGQGTCRFCDTVDNDDSSEDEVEILDNEAPTAAGNGNAGLSTTELFLMGRAPPQKQGTKGQSDDDDIVEILEDEEPVVRGRGRGRPRGRGRSGLNVRGALRQQSYGPSPTPVRSMSSPYSPVVSPMAASTPTRAIRGQRPTRPMGRGQRPIMRPFVRGRGQPQPRPLLYQPRPQPTTMNYGQPVIRRPAPNPMANLGIRPVRPVARPMMSNPGIRPVRPASTMMRPPQRRNVNPAFTRHSQPSYVPYVNDNITIDVVDDDDCIEVEEDSNTYSQLVTKLPPGINVQRVSK